MGLGTNCIERLEIQSRVHDVLLRLLYFRININVKRDVPYTRVVHKYSAYMSNALLGVVWRSVNDGVGGENMRVRVGKRVAGGPRRVGDLCVLCIEGGLCLWRRWQGGKDEGEARGVAFIPRCAVVPVRFLRASGPLSMALAWCGYSMCWASRAHSDGEQEMKEL